MRTIILGLLIIINVSEIHAEEFAQCHLWRPANEGIIQVQLWNPAESGVIVHVTRLLINSDYNSSWNIIATRKQFPELRNPGHSRHINNHAKASAKAELRGLNNKNRGEFQEYSLYVLSARAYQQLVLDTDIKIDPGNSLAVAQRNSEGSLAVCYDWNEVVIN